MGVELMLLMLSVNAQSSQSFAPSAHLFERLFVLPVSLDRPASPEFNRRLRQGEAGPQRRVCGMTLLTPDPSFQPRMPVLSPPPDRSYTLRVEQPSICTFAREGDPR